MNLNRRVLLRFGLFLGLMSAARSASAVTLNQGDVIVLESYPSRIVKIDPTTGQQTLITSAISDPLTEKVEYAPWGKLYAVTRNGSTGSLLEIDPSTGNVTTVSTGQYFINPRGLDFTSTGDVIVIDSGSTYFQGSAVRVDIATGQQTLLFSNYNQYGVWDGAVAPNGDLYVISPQGPLAKYNGTFANVAYLGGNGITFADAHHLISVATYGTGYIAQTTLPTGQVTTITSGGLLDNPLDVAVDRGTGSIYVANFDNPSIVKVDPISGMQSLLSSGGLLTAPTGITVVQNAVVPEPSTGMLLLCALGLLAAARCGCRRRAARPARGQS
jgi:DNA-binding beta-propeller fold protein YncE